MSSTLTKRGKWFALSLSILILIAVPILSVEFGDWLVGNFVDSQKKWPGNIRDGFGSVCNGAIDAGKWVNGLDGLTAIAGLIAATPVIFFICKILIWSVQKLKEKLSGRKLPSIKLKKLSWGLVITVILLGPVAWLLVWAGTYRDEMHNKASAIENFFSDAKSEVANSVSSFCQDYSVEIYTGAGIFVAFALISVILRLREDSRAKWVFIGGFILAAGVSTVIALIGSDISDAWNHHKMWFVLGPGFVIVAIVASYVFHVVGKRGNDGEDYAVGAALIAGVIGIVLVCGLASLVDNTGSAASVARQTAVTAGPTPGAPGKAEVSAPATPVKESTPAKSEAMAPAASEKNSTSFVTKAELKELEERQMSPQDVVVYSALGMLMALMIAAVFTFLVRRVMYLRSERL